MDKNSMVLSSLAMDLKRVALALNRGSIGSANIFKREVWKRKSEVNTGVLPDYIEDVINKLDRVLNQKK